MPRRHIVLDSEAMQVEQGKRKVQTFRCAVASLDYESKKGRGWKSVGPERFTDPRTLWEWVSECTRPKARTILVAHNLAYDLRICDAFTHLPALGWRLDMIRLDGGSAWAQWKREGATLSMCDTVSWFGVSVDQLAQLQGMTKPRLPRWDADITEWLARCEADVAILRRAWVAVLAWIEHADLGNWKPTGAGQGWAAFRHKHLTHRILHHGLEHLAAVEREAGWTGRCEAWRHGRLEKGPWTEYDMTSAYCHVAEDERVPTRLLGHLGAKSAQRLLDGPESDRILVRVVVDTETPVVPARSSYGVWWPVGRFQTTLWDIEAREAQAAGATVTAVEGWRYASEPALQQWATWVLDMLDAPTGAVDPILRLVVKGWSRSLIGRFGARWSTWEHFGDAVDGSIMLAKGRDVEADRTFRLMSLGDRTLAETEVVDAPDSATFIMSWIMAACRVRLWQVMTAAGLGNIAYVDTDSVMVNPEGARALEAAGFPGLRVKGQWGNVEILGPRQLLLGGKLRAAGIPKDSERTGKRSWRGEVWQSLAGAISAGETAQVTVSERTFTAHGLDRRRAHLPNGLTAAYRIE